MLWENPYEVIDTVPVVPAYPPDMTLCAIRKDGNFLYLLRYDRERELDFITVEQARRLVTFLARAMSRIEAEKPKIRSIGIAGQTGRFLRRVFNTYYGYRFLRSFVLRNISKALLGSASLTKLETKVTALCCSTIAASQ